MKEKFDNRKLVGVCSILEKSDEKKKREKKQNTEKNMKNMRTGGEREENFVIITGIGATVQHDLTQKAT